MKVSWLTTRVETIGYEKGLDNLEKENKYWYLNTISEDAVIIAMIFNFVLFLIEFFIVSPLLGWPNYPMQVAEIIIIFIIQIIIGYAIGIYYVNKRRRRCNKSE